MDEQKALTGVFPLRVYHVVQLKASRNPFSWLLPVRHTAFDYARSEKQRGVADVFLKPNQKPAEWPPVS